MNELVERMATIIVEQNKKNKYLEDMIVSQGKEINNLNNEVDN